MNQTLVDRVARALLYEGYILYPYRPSVKNRQRWTFGGLYPRSYCAAQGDGEPWSMQTECLVAGDGRSVIHGGVRFLHLMARQVAELLPAAHEPPAAGQPEYRFVETLRVGEQVHQTWQEAVEGEVALDDVELAALAEGPLRRDFALPPRGDREPVLDSARQPVGVIVREQHAVTGTVGLSARAVEEGLYRLTVRIENRTAWEPGGRPNRDEALMRSLVSTHTVLGVRGGEFVSLLDPPEAWRHHAAECGNVGTWPVLVGDEGERDTLLSSPIILYDYPQVAPESPGDLFDATEIDEILTLRILTLTEDEKRAMAALDERAGALLRRTEALSARELMALHGTLRTPRPPAGGTRHE